MRGGVADGRPQLRTAKHVAETIFRLSGTTNGRLAVEGFRQLERAHRHARSPTSRPTARTTGSRSSRSRIQPRKVITSPEWSGIESRTRRYSPFTVNVDREVPWRTLTGRQHFYLDHDWMLEFGEGLPAYRPPLSTARHAQGDLDPGDAEVVVRWISPHSKWSIHSEYQDNLRMLELFRGGPVVWISPGDAERIGVADNDWVEAVNRNGVIACRAVVSHRIPEGSAFMYHSQDRHVNVPISETSGHARRHRQLRHADHHQADAPDRRVRAALLGLQLLRRDRIPARCADADPQAQDGGDVLMRVMAQVGMVMNLDKCIGCHTCSVTCKNVWTNRKGAEYMWFNDVETKPGDRATPSAGRTRRSGRAAGSSTARGSCG